ncbi:hypothetical protein OUZ56_009771 [Daphnia magna]|uniref:Uncharacterized protein n=1 Tax=Daphnia magna TaxID=35525 RepID=A0ABR0AGV4_9CRUS|nr:hypothetical protein OUZ56_009771 [Daphnia magna]
MKKLVIGSKTGGAPDPDQLAKAILLFRNAPHMGGPSPAQLVSAMGSRPTTDCPSPAWPHRRGPCRHPASYIRPLGDPGGGSRNRQTTGLSTKDCSRALIPPKPPFPPAAHRHHARTISSGSPDAYGAPAPGRLSSGSSNAASGHPSRPGPACLSPPKGCTTGPELPPFN